MGWRVFDEGHGVNRSTWRKVIYYIRYTYIGFSCFFCCVFIWWHSYVFLRAFAAAFFPCFLSCLSLTANILWGSAAGDRQGVLLAFKPVVIPLVFYRGESCNSRFVWLGIGGGRMGSRMPRIEVCGCWRLSPNPPLQHLLLWTMPWLAPLGDTARSKRGIQSCEKYAYSCLTSFFVWQVFAKLLLFNVFSCSSHCYNSGYLSWIRSLACCAPYHWNWIAPLPQKTFNGTFFSGGLCVEPNPSMHKYFEVHRPSCELVKNCPLAAPRKNRHPDMSPPTTAPVVPKAYGVSLGGSQPLGCLWVECVKVGGLLLL